ncbi:MAG: hypothetical protein QG640_445 [Patescibacteria group bacterium]|nr:hypothetical protein [Patescibacteria group bacterium]
MKKRIIQFALILFLGPIIAYLLLIILVQPSNDRDWSTDQAVLASAEIKDNLVSIKNVRNFSYASTTSYTPAYYDKTYDINKLKKVWYVVEPFSGYVGAAHTLLSFEFENEQFVSISVEIRKEKGESFSAFKGLMRQYELMYVIADERDVIKLRSNYRKDLVYVYPVSADKEKAQALFLDMVQRAHDLNEQPEFYNTLTSTCTTNIVRHVNKITPERVAFNFDILFPVNSDRLALESGLIETELTLEEARKKFLINEKAEKYANDPRFSVKIRQ